LNGIKSKVVEEADLAGNPSALILQARTKTVIAKKFAADTKVCFFLSYSITWVK
jgi:hypothetical protein